MKISEMTMRTGKLNARMSQKFVNDNVHRWFETEPIGNIDHYDLRCYNKIYSLWEDENYVASAKLEDPDEHGISETGLFHVDSKYRGQKILSRLLWNFKSRQNRSIIKIDPYHSDDIYDILHSGGLSRFQKYWMNQSGEVVPFDPTKSDQYYSRLGKTGWQLILENQHDFSDMPQFTEGKNWITEDYSWQIE